MSDSEDDVRRGKVKKKSPRQATKRKKGKHKDDLPPKKYHVQKDISDSSSCSGMETDISGIISNCSVSTPINSMHKNNISHEKVSDKIVDDLIDVANVDPSLGINANVVPNSAVIANADDSSPAVQPTTARVDLNQFLESGLPENTRQLLVSHSDPNLKLTSNNPCKIEIGLNKICGKIEKLDYLKSGSILVTTKTLIQTEKLLKTTMLPEFNIPIKITIAWSRQLTYGKIWAPEFGNDTLQEMLKYLEPHNVVAVRKLFNNPTRAHTPLFVLTFFGKLPPYIILGSIRYEIGVFIPRPLRCRNCWRFGHSTKQCKSEPLCSKCGISKHDRNSCNNILKCINCKGDHEATDSICPKYQSEMDICRLTAEKGISFTEARNSLKPNPKITQSQPNFTTNDFPNLATTNSNARRDRTDSNQTQKRGFTTTYADKINKIGPTRYLPDMNAHASKFSNFQSFMNSDFEEENPNPENQYPIVQATPSQNSPYDDIFSQGCSYPRPGQRIRSKTKPNNRIDTTQSNDFLDELSFPEISSEWRQKSNYRNMTQANNSQYNYNRHNTQTEDQQTITPSRDSTDYLKTIIPQILPHIIKILFSTQLTDRIESITKIGQILKLDDIVATALSSVSLSSNEQ